MLCHMVIWYRGSISTKARSGEWKLVAYSLRSLTNTKQIYKQIEKRHSQLHGHATDLLMVHEQDSVVVMHERTN